MTTIRLLSLDDPAAFETLVQSCGSTGGVCAGPGGGRSRCRKSYRMCSSRCGNGARNGECRRGVLAGISTPRCGIKRANRLRHRRISHHRTVTLGAEIAGISMAEDALGRSADGAMAVHELASAVAHAMATLPPRCRETFELRAQHVAGGDRGSPRDTQGRRRPRPGRSSCSVRRWRIISAK